MYLKTRIYTHNVLFILTLQLSQYLAVLRTKYKQTRHFKFLRVNPGSGKQGHVAFSSHGPLLDQAAGSFLFHTEVLRKEDQQTGLGPPPYGTPAKAIRRAPIAWSFHQP